MYKLNRLIIDEITVEHLGKPLGIDCAQPRFAWKLESDVKNVRQTAYRLTITSDHSSFDSGKIESDASVEITADGFEAEPMSEYAVSLTVWDNHGRQAHALTAFETGRMGIPFKGSWAEPVQDPTPSSMSLERDGDTASKDVIKRDENGNRTYEEFRPAQYIRIPFKAEKPVRKARVYATAHGLYRLFVNGTCPDKRYFAPENTAADKFLNVQTYDITSLITQGSNVIGVILADGWWAGRVGTTGDCCQYGDKTALMLDADLEYMDGTKETVSADSGISSEGPVVFADLFVGEKYDAAKEMKGWSTPSFDDHDWKPVNKADYPADLFHGQRMAPVRDAEVFEPQAVFTSPNGDVIIDAGQNVAGFTEFTITCEAGHEIRLEHFEVLGKDGNYFNSILNINKEQTDIYITKDGKQTWHPWFTYHGFRYVRLHGWPGTPKTSDFRIHVITSQMDETGSFITSDERLNQLQRNIVYSQIANTVSIPTDCPQREKAGWTGDIMAYAPTLCFNRNADAFLSSWLDNVRAEQLESGAVPMIVPYLKAYATFLRDGLGTDTSCGWGDAAIIVPYALHQAYGDRRVLEENYETMVRWMEYIKDRAEIHHPEEYASWDEEHQARSRLLWNTDFHFGDWLIPSIVLGNSDAMAMNKTAYATMGIVAPAYYAFSAQNMAKIAKILGKEADAAYYEDLYERIREAFITEYVHEDGTMDADFQGIYVIALKMGLVPEEKKEMMVNHLCDMIRENGNKLDTGFLSVLFLMDVLCDNDREDIAYKLLFQTGCPSWLYEVEKGATTMWESWGAIDENGETSTYSYNHYAFGCVGEWMYRHIGGLRPLEAGYRKFSVRPSFTSDLTSAETVLSTPYGRTEVSWKLFGDQAAVHVEVPVNTEAVIQLPDMEETSTGSGTYDYLVKVK